jgi:hypothetical protein
MTAPRRIILSRKGFDSSAGGGPSPILPDGRLLSLPIPEAPGIAGTAYADLRAFGDLSYADVMRDLGITTVRAQAAAHRDPDIDDTIIRRAPGWRPVFGQSGAAERHLERQGVGAGDLFLFFGLFRRTELVEGHLRWVPGAPRRHIVFGYLEVDRVDRLDAGDAAPPWAAGHPHLNGAARTHNTLYTARRTLSSDRGRPGAGMLRLHQDLILTADGAAGPSQWRLPAAFAGPEGRPCLSYHDDTARWSVAEDGELRLRSAARGQEFVIPATPALLAWARGLIAAGSPSVAGPGALAR